MTFINFFWENRLFFWGGSWIITVCVSSDDDSILFAGIDAVKSVYGCGFFDKHVLSVDCHVLSTSSNSSELTTCYSYMICIADYIITVFVLVRLGAYVN